MLRETTTERNEKMRHKQGRFGLERRTTILMVTALVTTLLSTALVMSPASAQDDPDPTFNAVVDHNHLKIHRESDSPNSNWNADEPSLLVWRYEVELGNGNSGDATFLGRRLFSGRDARDRNGQQIHDLAGRYTLPSLPADGSHLMGTVTLVFDSDACGWITYQMIGNMMEDVLADALDAFALANPDVFALASTSDPLSALVDELELEPSAAQATTLVADCILSWGIPTLNFDDLIGIAATMILGAPAIPPFCDAAELVSGSQGTQTLLEFGSGVFSVNQTVETWFDAAVDTRSFSWNFDDDDAHYRLSGVIEVNTPNEFGSCPTPPPPPPPPPSVSICQELMIAWEAGDIDTFEYLAQAQSNNCPV